MRLRPNLALALVVVLALASLSNAVTQRGGSKDNSNRRASRRNAARAEPLYDAVRWEPRGSSTSYDPSYDHQSKPYTIQFEPVTVTDVNMNVQSYFSPDHSAGFEVELINSATSTLDIGTPGLNSWSNCTYFQGSPPIGCTIEEQKNELFPLFPAMVNAIHRGVTVRILTNNYDQGPPPGLIDPLTYLFYAGAEIYYYTSTTFMHAKYMAIDGATYSISSINWSYTSFMSNREAGMVLSGSAGAALYTFCDTVYNYDVTNGDVFVPNQNYSAADLAIIRSPDILPVDVPEPNYFKGAYKTEITNITGYMTTELYVSPDYAYNTTLTALNTAVSSVRVYIYQITDTDLCNWLVSFYKASDYNVVDILVSNQVYADWPQSEACYKTLYDAGITVQLTAYDMYTYSHQKFWIIDEETVVLSTGNWNPTDQPSLSGDTIPPYGNSGWMNTNRDYNVKVKNKDVADAYLTVFNADYALGSAYDPDEGLIHP